jgi:hypothetical protein
VTFFITLSLNWLSSLKDETCCKTELQQQEPKSLPENWWNVIFETEKFSNNGIPSRDKTKNNLSTGIIVSEKFSHIVAML